MKKNLALFLVLVFLIVNVGQVSLAKENVSSYKSQGEFYDMAYHNNTIVAVGYQGVVAISKDLGTSWSSVAPFCINTFRSIIWANNQFVAVTVAGEIFVSADGMDWILKYSNPISALLDIIWNGNLYIAVGTNGRAYISNDAEDWALIDTKIPETLYGIEWNGKFFVAVGSNGYAGISDNGVNWDEYSTGINSDLISVSWINGCFYAVGTRGTLLSSKDGINWIPTQLNTGETLWRIIWTDEQYVILGGSDLSGLVIGSRDGKSWETLTSNDKIGLYCGIYVDDAYVLGGGSWGTGSMIRATLPNITDAEDAVDGIDAVDGMLEKVIKYTAIAAGSDSTIAIRGDGTVWSWGDNKFGTLGNHSFEDSSNPVQVMGVNNVTAISAGENHYMALKSDGTVYSWGLNLNGQIGDGTTINRNFATLVKGLNDVVAISAGGSFCLALKKDGTVWGWGRNNSGELANYEMDGVLYKNWITPIQINGLTDVVSIAAAQNYSIALTKDQSVWAWGNGSWVANDGTKSTNVKGVQKLDCGNIKSIASGRNFSVLLSDTGTVTTFGSNYYGEIGNGSITEHYFATTPLYQVKELTNIESITTGDSLVIAKKSDGTYWGWGDNSLNFLLQSDNINIIVPTKLDKLNDINNIKSTAFGTNHIVVLKSDGSIFSSGLNYSGQLGIGNEFPCSFLIKLNLPSLYATAPSLKKKISSWATLPIDKLWTKGYLNSDLLEDFQKPITRGEFASLIANYYEGYIDSTILPSNTRPFEDIDHHAYEQDIIKAFELKIILGTKPNIYEPDRLITRQEIAVMMYNLMKVTNFSRLELVSDYTFTDNVQIAKWAKQAINFLYTNKIMAGVSNMTISPLTNATREQAFVLLSKFEELGYRR